MHGKLFAKFFELSNYHDIYGRLVEVGIKLGNSVIQKINVEDESAQWLYDFLVVHYVVYSDKTTIPKLIAKENTDELFGYLQLLAQLEPGHLSHMIDIVAKAVTLEKIYTGLATRALNELTKKIKSVGGCPELNYLCLLGYPENNSDLPRIIDFLQNVTEKYRLKKELDGDKVEFLNAALGIVVSKIQDLREHQKIEKIVNQKPLKDIFQHFQMEKRKESKGNQPHPDQFGYRFNGTEEEHEELLDNLPAKEDQQSFFNIDEHFDQLKNELGPAKAKFVKAIADADPHDFKASEKEIAKQLNKSIKTVQKHKKQLRDDPTALQKVGEIIFARE